jgi:hypothetical protein
MTPRTSRAAALAMYTLPIAAIAVGCATSTPESSDTSSEQIRQMHRHGVMPKQGVSAASAVRPQTAPSGAHLTYNGGRVNGAATVYVVLWGTGSYEAHVTSTDTPSMLSFYEQVLSNGSYASWLDSEYNTVSASFNGTQTNQHITAGSAVSVVSITPSSSATTVDDSTIQSELSAQISAGHLPAPAVDGQGNAVTYYAVFFPNGVTITQGGSSSCVGGGFCAYHGTVSSGGTEFYYGVHPDMQAGSGCDTGCGSAATAFGNYTSVASHELTEMITDAEVGIAGNGSGPPLAWYDNNNGEIGDICNAQQTTYTACDGQTYTIQQEFSNAQSDCIGYPAPSCGGASSSGGGSSSSGSGGSSSSGGGSSGSSSGGTGGGVLNGDFETGDLTGWTTSGANETIVSSGCYSGVYCAQLGSPNPTNGDSTASQTFTAPSGSSTVSVWYEMTCPDTVYYDWATVTLTDDTTGSSSTLLGQTCASGSWTNVTGSVTPGHSYTLTLLSHDDDNPGDATYTLFDDVTVR